MYYLCVLWCPLSGFLVPICFFNKASLPQTSENKEVLQRTTGGITFLSLFRNSGIHHMKYLEAWITWLLNVLWLAYHAYIAYHGTHFVVKLTPCSQTSKGLTCSTKCCKTNFSGRFSWPVFGGFPTGQGHWLTNCIHWCGQWRKNEEKGIFIEAIGASLINSQRTGSVVIVGVWTNLASLTTGKFEAAF